MMRGDFDTEANALEIDLIRSDRADYADIVDETYCHVAMVGEEAVNISLLSPADHLDLLAAVAERHDLDAKELLATAQAALAAPDQLVEVSIGKPLGA
jgi:hypothetical protein